MKRFSVSSSEEAKQRSNTSNGYGEEFQAMLDRLDEEDCGEDGVHVFEKKRRLRLDQVKFLERNFELEDKLEAERKVQLARELGLQPRQVAIWFQNRRARRKTKQLEHDYRVLKASYDSLKLDYNTLDQEKQSLTLELKELKEKLNRGSERKKCCFEEETPISESENIKNGEKQSKKSDYSENRASGVLVKEEITVSNVNSPLASNGSVSCLDSMTDWVHLCDRGVGVGEGYYQPQPMRMEEQSLFSIDESCSFFSVDQAPALQWYFAEQ